MTKPKKTNNTTSSKTDNTKAITHPFGVGIAHYTKLHADKIANEMIHSAINDENILTITDFLFTKGLYRQQLDTLCEKFPEVAQAKTIAMEAIGNRRERMAIQKKYDTTMIMASMPMFSKEWKELVEWKSKLTKHEEKTQTINVTLEAIPNSTMVPEKTE